MIHPLFAGFDERDDMRHIAEALGFDHRFELLDEFSEESPTLEAWNPETPEGFELAGKFHSEDAGFAMFVKPASQMAEALWVVASAFVEPEKTIPAEDRQCWSRDDEDFTCRTLGELLDRHYDLRPGDWVRVGKTKRLDPAGFLDVDQVLENMGECAMDEGGEWAEDYPDVTHAQRRQLEAFLDHWAKAYCQPTFYGVKDDRPYEITQADIEEATRHE